MALMPDRVLKPEIGNKGDIPTISPQDFLEEMARVDVYLTAGTEVSPVPNESRVVVYTDPGSAGADRFRLAQMGLKRLQAARKLRTLLITSPLPGDGKSTVALNLATVLSESGKVPVLLLEADVYQPTLTLKLGIKPWPGLTECYTHGDHAMMAIRRINPLGFYLLPAGQPVTGGVGLFESNFASQLFKSLSSSYFSWILIDSPPAIPVADILSLRAHADATLLVARAGKTPREAIEETTRHVGPDHVLGIILNGVEGINRAYAKYYGYGGYEGRSKHAKSKTIVGLGLDEHAR